MNYVIKADDNVVYTSKSFTKKDEPFSESSIDISNCNLLTVEFNTDKWGEGQAFMYDAVVLMRNNILIRTCIAFCISVV